MRGSRPRAAPHARLGRATLVAFGALIAGAACGDETTVHETTTTQASGGFGAGDGGIGGSGAGGEGGTSEGGAGGEGGEGGNIAPPYGAPPQE